MIRITGCQTDIVTSLAEVWIEICQRDRAGY